MILRRLGNKSKMASVLHSLFPMHKMRVEPFFGAGGSYFNMPKPKYAILNDLDDDIFNLYHVVMTDREKLAIEIELMPQSETLLKYWLKHNESDPVKKAVRFLMISNFSYLGKGDTMRFGLDNSKRSLIDNIEPTFMHLKDAKLMNQDFRDVISRISFSNVLSKDDTFIYLDPIYLNTTHWYKVPKWTVGDTEDCFKIMANSGIRCAMSEFDNKTVVDMAKRYDMNIINLKNRNNIRNRRTEILITNYSLDQQIINF